MTNQLKAVKLSYKDYLISLRYSIYRLIELHGPEAKIDIFIDEKNKSNSIYH